MEALSSGDADGEAIAAEEDQVGRVDEVDGHRPGGGAGSSAWWKRRREVLLDWLKKPVCVSKVLAVRRPRVEVPDHLPTEPGLFQTEDGQVDV